MFYPNYKFCAKVIIATEERKKLLKQDLPYKILLKRIYICLDVFQQNKIKSFIKKAFWTWRCSYAIYYAWYPVVDHGSTSVYVSLMFWLVGLDEHTLPKCFIWQVLKCSSSAHWADKDLRPARAEPSWLIAGNLM